MGSENYTVDVGDWAYEYSPRGQDDGWGTITEHIWKKVTIV
jgi:hypothetical protein